MNDNDKCRFISLNLAQVTQLARRKGLYDSAKAIFYQKSLLQYAIFPCVTNVAVVTVPVGLDMVVKLLVKLTCHWQGCLGGAGSSFNVVLIFATMPR